MATGLNKWAKKLEKEYKKSSFTEKERDFHEWHEDRETETTYTWKFDCPEDGTEREWVLNKKSGIITKCVVGYK